MTTRTTRSRSSEVYKFTRFRPLLCNFVTDGAFDVSSVCAEDNEKVTLNNKRAQFFQFEVPSKFTMSNVIVNSLDSLLPCKKCSCFAAPYLCCCYFCSDHEGDVMSCLNRRVQCCTTSSSGAI